MTLLVLGGTAEARALAGVAGALFAFFGRYASASYMFYHISGEAVVWAIVGGAGTLFGPIVGTSLFNIVFVTAATTLLHSVESQSVDIVLAMLLLVGGVVGAQFGVRAAQKLPPERLRLFLALIVVGVAVRLAIGLTWRPAELFTVYGPS